MTDVVDSVVGGAVPGLRALVPLPSPLRDVPVPLTRNPLVQMSAGTHLDDVTAQAFEVGLRRVQILAWRDLEDNEAGGSELVADRVAANWAKAGLEVTLRTPRAAGLDKVSSRDGYRIVRKSGRHTVLPHSVLKGLTKRREKLDGLVEVWNGMPFFSPLWAHCPRVVVVHRIQDEVGRTGLRSRLARLGEAIELRLTPRLYRQSHIVTDSASSRDDLVAMMGFDPRRIDVVPHGVDEGFSPGGLRSPKPLVVAVGRLLPIKRCDLLVDALVDARKFVPDLHAEILGDGRERDRIQAKITDARADDWISVRGRVSDAELLDAYRRAWIVASTSAHEGCNLTVAEAGACGTPAVATEVPGNRDSVRHEVSGLLAHPGPEFTSALVRVLSDEVLRQRLSRGALQRSSELTWEASAAGLLSALVEEARAKVVGDSASHRRMT